MRSAVRHSLCVADNAEDGMSKCLGHKGIQRDPNQDAMLQVGAALRGPVCDQQRYSLQR
jgi:hypothetical protein